MAAVRFVSAASMFMCTSSSDASHLNSPDAISFSITQFVFNLVPLFCSYDFRPGEASGMRDRAIYIVPIKSAIERGGFAVALRKLCSGLV